MPSIESSGLPLVFSVAGDAVPRPPLAHRGGTTVAIRTLARALEGMQKEALVSLSPERAWRLVSDEGHYLNGTDLAPPPLDFFMAGVQFCVLSQVLRAARARGVEIRKLALTQDNLYAIEGSFLRGDAQGSAKSPDLAISLAADAAPEAITPLVQAAVSASPALALVRHPLKNRFGLSMGGLRQPLAGLRAAADPPPAHPRQAFASLVPVGIPSFDVITRSSRAEAVAGHADGGVGLQAEQKRTIHIRGRAEWMGGIRFRSDVDLLRPAGSSFRFHADGAAEDSGPGEAPPPHAYLVAGIAFCFMTQIGRYAKILKRDLGDYQVVQDNGFELSGSPIDEGWSALAHPVTTELFLEAAWEKEACAQLVRTGERTCYLHATMRGEHTPRVQIELNGQPLLGDS